MGCGMWDVRFEIAARGSGIGDVRFQIADWRGHRAEGMGHRIRRDGRSGETRNEINGEVGRRNVELFAVLKANGLNRPNRLTG